MINKIWKLNHFLLLNLEVKKQIQKEIVLFYAVNGKTPFCGEYKGYKVLLWDTFKAYIRGAFVSQKAYLNKKRCMASKEMLEEITALEAQHKVTRSKELKQEL